MDGTRLPPPLPFAAAAPPPVGLPMMPTPLAVGAVPMMRSMPPMMPAIEEFPENNTLYIRNINERLKQAKIKTSLRAVFKQFGDIVDVYCWAKSHKRKGQAWVVFTDVESAKRAKQAMQGFPFFHKPLILRFAKADSDVIAKEKGTFVTRVERVQKRKEAQEARKASAAAGSQQQWQADGAYQFGTHPPFAQPAEEYPNKILFVTNLPDDVTDSMLQILFSQYQGFVEVRLVPGRGMAFVEYQDEMQAMTAKIELQKFKISPDHEMTITFSKK